MKSCVFPVLFHVPLRNRNVCEDSDVHVQGCQISVSDFLSSEPHSSYTCFLSTKNGTKLTQFEFHCSRLLTGLKALEPQSMLPSCSELKATLKSYVTSILGNFEIPADTELLFVAVLSCAKCQPYLRLHVALVASEILKHLTLSFVAVECRKGRRVRPAIKNTSWCHERVFFERTRDRNAKETVLVAENQEGDPVLLEGLITNFFVITDDLEVLTADSKWVLSGSMRDLVLRACKDLNVIVSEAAVPLRSWKKYQAAFLTNARRMIQPVSALDTSHCMTESLPDIPDVIRLPENCAAVDLMRRLQVHVLRIVESEGEPILSK